MLMLWSPVRAAPARYLPQITAEYMISYLGVDVGRSRLELRAISKGRYRLKLRTRTIGVIQPVYPLRHQAESRVNLGDNEIRPVRFLWETRLWGPPERHTIHFDWRKRRATVWRQDERIIVPLPEGSIHDRVSLVPAIMFDLTHGKLQKSYTLFDGKRLRDYPMTLMGQEQLSTAVGALEVVRVERPVTGKPERTIAWLAPSLGYLPVRVTHMKGKRSTIEVEILSHTPVTVR